MSLVPVVECTVKVGNASFNGQMVSKERLRHTNKKKFFDRAMADFRDLIAHSGNNLPATLMGKYYTQVHFDSAACDIQHVCVTCMVRVRVTSLLNQ